MAFNENTRVKIPAILHLNRLGYNYISLARAKWDVETNIFTDIFNESITRINPDIEADELKRTFEDISLLIPNQYVMYYEFIQEPINKIKGGTYQKTLFDI